MSTTTTIQLDPPITVDTPRGKGEAYFKTEYGPDSYTLFGVFLRDSGEFWEFRAPHIRLFWNETMATGRRPGSPPISESTHTADSVKPDSGSITGSTVCRITHQPCPTPLSCSIHCQVATRSQEAQRQIKPGKIEHVPEGWMTGQTQQEMYKAQEDLTKGASVKPFGQDGKPLADGRYMHLPQGLPTPLACEARPLPEPEPKPLPGFIHCSVCDRTKTCFHNGFCAKEVRV